VRRSSSEAPSQIPPLIAPMDAQAASEALLGGLAANVKPPLTARGPGRIDRQPGVSAGTSLQASVASSVSDIRRPRFHWALVVSHGMLGR
jgi:hypothetical protein